MQNFYSSLSNKYKNNSFNPNYGKTHFIKIPARLLIVGGSGSGKSNCLCCLIKAFNGTFSHIYLCVKSSDEPLYNMLIDKLKENITVFENGIVPDLKDIPKIKDAEQLIVFDDLVGDKEATKKIIEYYKMSRKKNVSNCYLSQSFFRVDKFIRQNLTYIIIKKISSRRDLKLILSEYSFNCTLDELEKMYHYATKEFENILLLDLLNSHIYKNFTERLL